jgi:hypothetical protein
VWDKDKNVHLALNILEPTQEAVLAKGKPPQNKPGNPKEYTYLIAYNKGENIRSCFTNVIEPYENQCEILKAESVPVTFKDGKDGSDAGFTAKAVKVTLKNGRIDYILNSIDDNTYIADDKIEFQGFLTVLSEIKGKIVYRYVDDSDYCRFNDQTIVSSNSTIKGHVVDFTKEMTHANRIFVKLDKDVCPSDLKGAYVNIETDKIRNGFYEILSAKKNDLDLYEIDIGNITLIRSYVDSENFEKGYLYNILEGAPLKIVLPEEDFFVFER